MSADQHCPPSTLEASAALIPTDTQTFIHTESETPFDTTTHNEEPESTDASTVEDTTVTTTSVIKLPSANSDQGPITTDDNAVPAKQAQEVKSSIGSPQPVSHLRTPGGVTSIPTPVEVVCLAGPALPPYGRPAPSYGPPAPPGRPAPPRGPPAPPGSTAMPSRRPVKCYKKMAKTPSDRAATGRTNARPSGNAGPSTSTSSANVPCLNDPEKRKPDTMDESENDDRLAKRTREGEKRG